MISIHQCRLQALEHFFRPECLDGDNAYQCDVCRRRVPATRRTELTSLPPCLVLHLKRFGTGLDGKITREVAFPARLFMDEYLAGGDEYQLWGVVVHDGYTPHLGHYVAFVRTLLRGDGALHVD